jgi:hypothetical protein
MHVAPPRASSLQARESLLVDEPKLDFAQLRVNPPDEAEKLIARARRHSPRHLLREIGKREAWPVDEVAQR